MSKELDCALSEAPKELVKEIIQGLIKDRLKKAITSSEWIENIDEQIETLLTKEVKKVLDVEVKKYVEKYGDKIIEDAIDCIIEEDGLPQKAQYAIENCIKNIVIDKFNAKK